MSVSSGVVKKTAKTALKGNYLKAVITATVYVFILIICIFCADLFSMFLGRAVGVIWFLLLLVSIIIPITLGYIYFNTRLIFTSVCEPLLIAKYFSDRADYKKAVKFSVFIVWKTALTGAVLFLPAFITDLLASGKVFSAFSISVPVWTSGLWAISSFLKVTATVLLIFIMLKYYLAPFLITADEDMEPAEAVYMAKIISFRTKKDFIWLALSFILYIISCVFVIPLIFVLPLLSSAYTVHSRFSVADYNRNIDKTNSAKTPGFSADISF